MTQATATLRDRAPEPAAPPRTAPQTAPPAAAVAVVRKKRNGTRRFFLLVVLPVVAVAGGFTWWLSGGRYISTDNAYVGADKALVTPYVTGPIVAVHVIEGQHVKVGDPLFDIDPAPYETARCAGAGAAGGGQGRVRQPSASPIAHNLDQIKMGEESVKLRQADFDRKRTLVESKSGTRADQDVSQAALVQAQQILEFVRSMEATAKVKLGGGPDMPIEKFPDYMQAKAGVDDAERNLGYTHVKASIDGVATQVANIELGRVAPAGQAVFAVVADKNLWVDANPKESDLTYVKQGQPATVTIDTYPDRDWKGHVCSIAPGHGRAIRDPAAAERQRQLGQGRAAHPAALLLR